MENIEKQWKSVYILGGISTIIVLTGILLDMVVGSITGGNLSALPQTAIERFAQFNDNALLGLYNLDLLNMIIQLIMISVYFALFTAHRTVNLPYGLLAFIIFLTGSIILVANNTALPMNELANKYFSTPVESQKAYYAAAGEAMLVRGAHGSSGVFIGFFLPNLAGLIMSIVMLKGNIFTKINSWLGIIGSILMMLYVVSVNFITGAETMATAIAMPGGLLLMVWMVLFSIKFFKLIK